MNDRLPGSCWSNPIWYREKWRIYLSDCHSFSMQYAYTHDDFDGAEDAHDKRHGYGSSVVNCKLQIYQEFYDEDDN